MRTPHHLSRVFRLSRVLLCMIVGFGHAGWASAGRTAPAHSHPEYRLTVVGPANSTATDINQDGVVVGYVRSSDTYTRGFLNRGKGLVYLDKVGATSSDAVAINDKGQVLGNWRTAAGVQRGYIYHAGVRRDIGAIPGRNTTYTDINNAGYATALAFVPDSYAVRSFVRAPDGKLRDIGSLPVTDPMSFAYAINNSNKIAGASGPLVYPDQPLRAILWAKGKMQDLGDLGTSPNEGHAINDCGQVTGFASLFAGYRNRVAFLYSHGRMINIDGRPDTEERSSAGAGINNFGHVVGWSDHLSGFIYRGRRMESLNALADTKQRWNIAGANAINDAGQIAATAYRDGVSYAVRLDLIRPLLQRMPELEQDDGAVALGSKAADEAQAKAEAQAQAREVVQAISQP